MIRHAFTMKLLPGHEAEYQKRHDEIWPELTQLLREAGISDYSIYLDQQTGILFAVQKLSDQNQSQSLASHSVMRKWWDYMKDLMECHPDGRPIEKPLTLMFHLD